MNKTSSIVITRKLTLTFAAFFLWLALAGGILQFLLGGKVIGGSFILIGIVIILALIDGRLIKLLIGRKLQKTNLYVSLFILVLIAGNEISALLTTKSISELNRLVHAVFVVGFGILMLVMIWQIAVANRSDG